MKKLNQNGLTYIEILIYIVIVVIMLNAIVTFAWNIIGSGQKSSTQQEVSTQARFLAERIKKEVRDATSIISCGNVTSTRLELENTIDPTKNTKICYSANTVSIVQGNPVPSCPGTNNNLHSDETIVTSFTCTDLAGAGTDNVQINFTLTDNNSGSRQEYTNSIDMQFSVETRN